MARRPVQKAASRKTVPEKLVRQKGGHVGLVKSVDPVVVVGLRAPVLVPPDGKWHVIARPDPSKRFDALYLVERREGNTETYGQLACGKRTTDVVSAPSVIALTTAWSANLICAALNAADMVEGALAVVRRDNKGRNGNGVTAKQSRRRLRRSPPRNVS